MCGAGRRRSITTTRRQTHPWRGLWAGLPKTDGARVEITSASWPTRSGDAASPLPLASRRRSARAFQPAHWPTPLGSRTLYANPSLIGRTVEIEIGPGTHYLNIGEFTSAAGNPVGFAFNETMLATDVLLRGEASRDATETLIVPNGTAPADGVLFSLIRRTAAFERLTIQNSTGPVSCSCGHPVTRLRPPSRARTPPAPCTPVPADGAVTTHHVPPHAPRTPPPPSPIGLLTGPSCRPSSWTGAS